MLILTFPEHFSHVSSLFFRKCFVLQSSTPHFYAVALTEKRTITLTKFPYQRVSSPPLVVSGSCDWMLVKKKLDCNLEFFGLSMTPPGFPTTPDQQTCHFQLNCCYILLKTRNFRVLKDLAQFHVIIQQKGCLYAV